MIFAGTVALTGLTNENSFNMDTARYFLALFLVITLPALFLYWLLIHPFIIFWRGKGIATTYTIVLTLLAAAMLGMFSLRHYLLVRDFGTNYLLVGLGAALLILAGVLGRAIQKQLGVKTLLGLPELAPKRFPRRLVADGIYARLRHPRYVQLLIAFIGYALIANHLAVYLIVALWIPAIYVIARLEERELRAHFGHAYDDYCHQVPRFVPKLMQTSKTMGDP